MCGTCGRGMNLLTTPTTYETPGLVWIGRLVFPATFDTAPYRLILHLILSEAHGWLQLEFQLAYNQASQFLLGNQVYTSFN